VEKKTLSYVSSSKVAVLIFDIIVDDYVHMKNVFRTSIGGMFTFAIGLLIRVFSPFSGLIITISNLIENVLETADCPCLINFN